MSSKKLIVKLVLASMFLALALVLPFVTGHIKEIGNMLCPMHIPVLLCGFLVGPIYAGFIGFVAPLLRFSLFGMPPIIPIGLAMSFELATYGIIAGLLYRRLGKSTFNIYVSLITSMIMGRIVWGIVRLLMFNLIGSEFGRAAFIAGAFTNAIPGIILQLVLIPMLVKSFKRYID